MIFWKIVKQEFKNILTDPGAILVMLLGVFMYSMFYAIPYAHEVLRNVPVGAIDMDNSKLSRAFVRDIDAGEYVDVTYRPISIEDAKDKFYSGKIKAFLVIPKDFQRDLYRGKPTKASLYADSSYLLIYRQIATGVMTTSAYLGAKIEIMKMSVQKVPLPMAMTVKMPFEYVQEPLFNPSGGYASYIYPIVLILILQQTLLVGIGLLGGTMREQKNQYCEFTKNIYLAVFAKSTAFVLLYLLHSISYFLIFPVLFNYPMHYNLIPLILLLVPFLYSVAFLANSLVSFFKERETALLVLVVTALPMVFLPGFVWPKESISPILLTFADMVPATTAIKGLVKLNQMGASFYQVKWQILGLIILACFYYFCAVLSMKKCSEEISNDDDTDN